LLGSLILNGSNSVLIPALNSPVIDSIPNGTNECGISPFTVDQRGTLHPIDSNGDMVPACEKGAVERVVPTAASVSVSGRVLAEGAGVSGAIVTMTDAAGETRSARTNSFGYYRFTDVQVGAAYIFIVFSKQYSFSPQTITVYEEMTDLNFTMGK
jgi:hypothetical protein